MKKNFPYISSIFFSKSKQNPCLGTGFHCIDGDFSSAIYHAIGLAHHLFYTEDIEK